MSPYLTAQSGPRLLRRASVRPHRYERSGHDTSRDSGQEELVKLKCRVKRFRTMFNQKPDLRSVGLLAVAMSGILDTCHQILFETPVPAHARREVEEILDALNWAQNFCAELGAQQEQERWK